MNAKNLTLALAALWTVAGCGGNDRLARVSGTITLDGRPLPHAFVTFAPLRDGTTSYGRTDDNGTYEMMFTDTQPGAFIGESIVRISTFDLARNETDRGSPERVPPAYNKKSKLRCDVKAGKNSFDFELATSESVSP